MYGAIGVLWLASVALRSLSKRLEERADAAAREHGQDEGACARVLARIHEKNVVPAILGVQRSTHPELYDRLVTAGLTPEYARPERAPQLVPLLAGMALIAYLVAAIVLHFEAVHMSKVSGGPWPEVITGG